MDSVIMYCALFVKLCGTNAMTLSHVVIIISHGGERVLGDTLWLAPPVARGKGRLVWPTFISLAWSCGGWLVWVNGLFYSI